MENTNFQIQEQKPDHHFRTEIPNIILDSDIDMYTLGVYLKLKKIAGDSGGCWYSNKKLSEYCKISETKLRECLDNLETEGKYLSCALIKKEQRFSTDGSQNSNLITIIPVWRLNGDKYNNKLNKQNIVTPPVFGEGGGAPHEGGGAPGEDKEEPSKKIHIKTGGGGSEKKIGLNYKNSKGQEQHVSESDIYQHFLKSNFETYIVSSAIEETKQYNEKISNIFNFLESICIRLTKQKENQTKEKQWKKENSQKNSYKEKESKKNYYEKQDSKEPSPNVRDRRSEYVTMASLLQRLNCQKSM